MLRSSLALVLVAFAAPVWADGFISPKAASPPAYADSLAERSQEAVIILTQEDGMAQEDLIVKIEADGDKRLDGFAWIIPLPNEPSVMEKADGEVFEELYDYVQEHKKKYSAVGGGFGKGGYGGDMSVEVLQRETVGVYDIAVVRETKEASLNGWLEEEGYRAIDFDKIDGAARVLEYYRRREFVFACIKVEGVEFNSSSVDLHPVRFHFATGGVDCAYFPMLLTGLQDKPFDVNLYVFHRRPLNATPQRLGYETFGFHREYAEFLADDETPNEPRIIPVGYGQYRRVSTETAFQRTPKQLGRFAESLEDVHPNERFLLTNISAHGLDPTKVRAWKTDMWLTPRYDDLSDPPIDAQDGGLLRGMYDRNSAGE